jgi:hypothetical protein
MSVQPDRLLTRPSQLETSLVETALARPATSRTPFASRSLLLAGFGKKLKKRALILVQTEPNPFTISIILRNSRRKNAEKRAKTAHFQPFSARFRAFLGLFWHLARSPYYRLTSPVSNSPFFAFPVLDLLCLIPGPESSVYRYGGMARYGEV